MSPEFYATIGSAIGLASLMLGLSGIFFFLLTHSGRRMDRIEVRMDRLEDRMDRLEHRMERMENRLVESINLLREAIHSVDKRVAKLEWMFEVQFGRRLPPHESAEEEA